MALLLTFAVAARAQDPSLFLTKQDITERLQVARREPWAKRSLDSLVTEADRFPAEYMQRFGVADGSPPPEGGQWLHWYACPETGTPLQFRPPDQNICPDTGKNLTGYPYDHVVYQMRNDALSEAAVALGLAYRFTGKQDYAGKAAGILRQYTAVYPSYKLHDNSGKPGINGGKAYSQTLDESIWLIRIAWTYDLVRGSGVMSTQEKAGFETNVLRAAEQVVAKAHKEPTYNIQSWINSAIAAVGYVLGDQAMISEAIDGPIGFRHQMHTFVHEGFWEEGAWGYQFYAMRPLTMLAQMAACNGINLWKEEPALLTLFYGAVGVVLPNGKLPAFNDSNETDLFAQDYLYEVAYAATRDPRLLFVLDHSARDDREALLFGQEKLPQQASEKLVSQVFSQAGYATLRSDTNDLTAIMKFGSHGGAHGHYDKLNFILYGDGMTLAIDPGTQLYGVPTHREWDSKTIAHNTVSVDQQRQAAATGKLLDWHTGTGWTEVRADAGPAYPQARLQRTMLLTPEYVLILDHDTSTDGQPHMFDWAYHNAGSATLLGNVNTESYTGFPQANGYGLLKDVTHAFVADDIAVRFVAQSGRQESADHNGNSTPATIRSARPEPHSLARAGEVQVGLHMLGKQGTDLFVGRAPGPNLRIPMPFVLARRSGTDVEFSTLLNVARSGQSKGAESIALQKTGPTTYEVRGEHFVDTIGNDATFSYHRSPR